MREQLFDPILAQLWAATLERAQCRPTDNRGVVSFELEREREHESEQLGRQTPSRNI
jgi:hypothetical protein